MLDALRGSNPEMDDDAMLQHLVDGRDVAVAESRDEHARSLQQIINLIRFERPRQGPQETSEEEY